MTAQYSYLDHGEIAQVPINIPIPMFINNTDPKNPATTYFTHEKCQTILSLLYIYLFIFTMIHLIDCHEF